MLDEHTCAGGQQEERLRHITIRYTMICFAWTLMIKSPRADVTGRCEQGQRELTVSSFTHPRVLSSTQNCIKYTHLHDTIIRSSGLFVKISSYFWDQNRTRTSGLLLPNKFPKYSSYFPCVPCAFPFISIAAAYLKQTPPSSSSSSDKPTYGVLIKRNFFNFPW